MLDIQSTAGLELLRAPLDLECKLAVGRDEKKCCRLSMEANG